jgi:hypothetical protein
MVTQLGKRNLESSVKLTTKNPIYSAKLVHALALKYAAENAFTLSKEECEALELVGRNIHRLKRIWKPKS